MDTNETINQLGGNQFIAMTGAKNFIKGSNELTFKIGRNCKGITHVKIELNVLDTYDITFLSVRNGKRGISIKEEKVDNIYNDQLQEVFTNHTGMYTHF